MKILASISEVTIFRSFLLKPNHCITKNVGGRGNTVLFYHLSIWGKFLMGQGERERQKKRKTCHWGLESIEKPLLLHSLSPEGEGNEETSKRMSWKSRARGVSHV